MTQHSDLRCSAFCGERLIAQGDLLHVSLKAKDYLERKGEATFLVFDNQSSKPVELDLRGSKEEIKARIILNHHQPAPAKTKPGRPKLGVISREISLLPQHWDWLGLQPGGASATLRKLVTQAKKKDQGSEKLRKIQDATYNFIRVMAGDLKNYEEALRALYARDGTAFMSLSGKWPKDIRQHAYKLSEGLF